MRTLGTNTTAMLQSRRGIIARPLLWIVAKDRSTGAATPIGFWGGPDNETITIDGVDRVYYGAGNLIGLDAITYQTGLTVRMQRVTMSSLSAEAQQALRTYDPRFAAVEVHRAFYDLDNGNLLDTPQKVFSGWIDQAPIATPAKGGQASASLTLSGQEQIFTRTLSVVKSQAALAGRSSTDTFRKYADLAGQIEVQWGQGKQRIPQQVIRQPTASAAKNPLFYGR
ncbi:MAG: hypothetical protein PF443_07850 [Allgaiera sp.]|jgi:hypothetical protein|nr:hypothetical protein [Allgaiera sp.]